MYDSSPAFLTDPHEGAAHVLDLPHEVAVGAEVHLVLGPSVGAVLAASGPVRAKKKTHGDIPVHPCICGTYNIPSIPDHLVCVSRCCGFGVWKSWPCGAPRHVGRRFPGVRVWVCVTPWCLGGALH